MNTKQILSDLRSAMELARDDVEQANHAFCSAKEKFQEVERFTNETSPSGEIRIINSDGYGNSLALLECNYRLDGRTVLFTVTEASKRYVTYIGQIVDCAERTVLYACQFYCDGYKEKQDLFDHLLTNYIEWRFYL